MDGIRDACAAVVVMMLWFFFGGAWLCGVIIAADRGDSVGAAINFFIAPLGIWEGLKFFFG